MISKNKHRQASPNAIRSPDKQQAELSRQGSKLMYDKALTSCPEGQGGEGHLKNAVNLTRT